MWIYHCVHYGSVQTLKDRRLGIYQLHFTEQDETRDVANEVLKEKKYNLINTIFYESDSNDLQYKKVIRLFKCCQYIANGWL